MNPDPPWLLSYCAGSGGIAGITENQQVMPGSLSVLSEAQVPSGVGSKPMFSIATLKARIRLAVAEGDRQASFERVLVEGELLRAVEDAAADARGTCGNSS